jgi:hypothetical protein
MPKENIFPFRNVYDQATPTDCEICGEAIEPFTGYAVVGPNKVVDGYVCQPCFERSEDCEDKSKVDIIFAAPFNLTTIH